jgi:hypothetical protein
LKAEFQNPAEEAGACTEPLQNRKTYRNPETALLPGLYPKSSEKWRQSIQKSCSGHPANEMTFVCLVGKLKRWKKITLKMLIVIA